MTQRKLTDGEWQCVEDARVAVGNMCHWADTAKGHRFWFDVALQLCDMQENRTTDGKPYVDPVPPIPDGYRLAVAGDEGREDHEVYDFRTKQWVPLIHSVYPSDAIFIVPADRTPTDEDAKSRPAVMVLDCDGTDWEKQKLVFVNGCADAVRKFVTVDSDSQCAYEWKYCRHLYPGE